MTGVPRVLYISGWLRSGSTILGNVLNELPGVLHVGELHYLWLNGLLRRGTNSQCGCGEEVSVCPLWSKVVASLGPSDVEAQAERMTSLQAATLRTRQIWARLHDRRRSGSAAVTETLNQMADVYRTLAGSGGERLIVDSSKYPAEAAALLGRADLDVRVLHLVRDPRAIAYSYLRSKEYISPMSPSWSTRHWTGFNLASELMGAAVPARYLRLRYEDFTTRPGEAINRVMEFAGATGATPSGLDEGSIRLGANHTVTGNPDRLSHGTVSLRPDERWLRDLPRRHRLVATAIALPLLRRYGYQVLPPRITKRAKGQELGWTSD
jgi:Sulfotransferase family